MFVAKLFERQLTTLQNMASVSPVGVLKDLPAGFDHSLAEYVEVDANERVLVDALRSKGKPKTRQSTGAYNKRFHTCRDGDSGCRNPNQRR